MELYCKTAKIKNYFLTIPNLNAAQGYKIYKLLHDARIQRRELKDELQKIEMSLGTSMRSSNMENLEKSIVGMDNRKYSPRVNKELFGV